MTLSGALAIPRAEGVAAIRLVFCDLAGTARTVWLPLCHLDRALAHGVAIDPASAGVSDEHGADLLLRPDTSTFRVWPAAAGIAASGLVLCRLTTLAGAPAADDTRGVLECVVDQCRRHGYETLVGAELEYYYVRPSSGEPADGGQYCEASHRDACRAARQASVDVLSQMDVEIEYALHECGPGQHEIVVGKRDAVRAADEVVIRKIVIREIAAAHGLTATFMPKPFAHLAGSGMHLHQSLRCEGEAILYDPDGLGGLSKLGQHFLAGQLGHTADMVLALAQWVNSYKRLGAGCAAPAAITWGVENRSTLIRVPRARPEVPEDYRLEITAPDAAANPYLAIAAVLAAGLDGIDRQLVPPPPVNGDANELSDEELARLGCRRLPETLGDALRLAERSAFLARLLGPELHARLIAEKRRHWRDHNTHVHPYERAQLLEIA